MQSFRERSGFHGNQPCYQQEAHELSRLENYRHHHGQARQGYEAHSLSPATGAGPKDCYGQPAYQGYGAGSAPAKKQYKGGKVSGQPPPAGFGNRLGAAYLAQYLSEGHLQQKWGDPSHPGQYKQDMVGRLEVAAGPGSTTPQYLEQNVQSISQSQCSHAGQPSAATYTSHHQQSLPQNSSPSPLAYSQGHLHFPQHSQPLSTSTSSYMEKCTSAPHCYKGYPMPPNSQYSRPIGNNNNTLKQSTYRSQNSYTYQQPASRAGYDQQGPLQGMSSTQDGLSKYQHFSQQQQNYCLSDMAVRSPEHYYQNCSPSSNHSPARSVGRSPSYSSTPSPLMVNSETFQYNQQPIHTGNPSSTNLPEQGLLMPPHSHTSPSVNQPTASYTSSMKDRFSEKLLSNPSLWSLNALTSQVENISNNVQQLLLSEALISNKKGGKRNGPKKSDDFKGQLRPLEETSCSDVHQGTPVPETFSTPQSIHTEMQEGGYSSSSEDQLERNYYCCGQNRSPVQANANPQLTQDLVSSCSLTSPNDMPTKSEDCVSSLQSSQAEDLNALPWLQSTQARETVNATLINTGVKSPQSSVTSSPRKAEQNSPTDRLGEGDSLTQNFEELDWSDKQADQNKAMKEPALTDCNQTRVSQESEEEERQKSEQDWPEEKALFHTVNKAPTERKYYSDMEDKLNQDIQNQYDSREEGSAENSDDLSHLGHKGDEDGDKKPMKSEIYRSEMPTDPDMPEKMSFFWRDDLTQDQYLTVKGDNSELPQFTSRSELLEERLLTVEKETREALEQQPPVLSHQPAEVRKEKETLLPSEEVINNTIWSRESGDFCHLAEEHGDKPPASTETTMQDMVPARAERRSAACDSVSPSHGIKTVFSALTEKTTTPPAQAREHIDRRDAEVLEPDSPQLPGKSILHSAPSWADTPPSPKKGDEDIEPGISCPSAVTPSTKSEPVAPLANIRVLNRKLGRGRRSQAARAIEAEVRMRRHSEMEGVTSSTQMNTLSSSDTGLFPDQPNSSQTPKRFAESFPSRMCTRSVTALASPKDCLHLKRQLGPKMPERPNVDSLTHPKDLVTKIKWMRQKGPENTAIDQVSLTGSGQQDDNQDHASHLHPLAKVQKPMVLRSRKPTQENALKEKGKEKKILCYLPKKMKDPKTTKDVLLNSEGCVSPKQIQTSSQKAYQILTGHSDEIIPPSKRKSSFHSVVPSKKHKGMKAGAPEMKEPHLPASLIGVKGPKKKLKQAEHFQASLSSSLVKDIPMTNSTGEIHCSPPQCPTKTKYLPPRKGRGLKYEAMVQKITSPGSKKHLPFPQAENAAVDMTLKAPQQDLLPNEMEKAVEEMPKESNTWSIVPMLDADCAKATIRRRKGASAKNEEEAGVTAETNDPTVNTPRLAKQRAIKNNHEMHLKQRRKRRRGIPLPKCASSVEQHEPRLDSLAPDYTGDLTGTSRVIAAADICKKGERKLPPAKKSQARGLGKDSGKKQNVIKKSGPKRRNRKPSKAGKTTETGQRSKARQTERSSPVVQENQPETSLKYILYKTPKNESRASFSPYVHIDSSRSFASLCTVVNRPEEELLLLQTIKKNSAKIKNSVTVGKAMPNSSVMLQGPLVNKNLTDRCLTCCLCGKPANYRELGDLCGPYYPEDSIPRKTLSLRHELESVEDREEMSCSVVPNSPPKREALSGSGCWGSRGGQPGPTRRAEGLPGASVPRPSFREQYRKLQRFQGYERRPGEADSTTALLRRMQQEAEAKEHWAHEACAVWTNGVVLVAGKLYGLKEAARAAAQTPCSLCQNVGASVSCCWKGCPQKFHFACAKETGCLLREDNFSMKCTKHKSA